MVTRGSPLVCDVQTILTPSTRAGSCLPAMNQPRVGISASPYTTIVAALARTKEDVNGTSSWSGLNLLLRRRREVNVLKPDCVAYWHKDLAELTRILRGTLSLIESKVKQPLDYIRLLQQLSHFHFDAQRVKAQWAQEFYQKSKDDLVKEDT